MPKFVMLDSQKLFGADAGIELNRNMLNAHGIDVVMAECKNDEDIFKVAADADAIGVAFQKIDGPIMDGLKKCRVIVRYGIGYEGVAVHEATMRGIAVCNLPDYCIPDVATHTQGMILDCCRKLTFLNRKMREGTWNAACGYRISRLSNLKLGLIGFGNIARKLVDYMKPYNMRILAYDPYLNADVFSRMGVKQTTLDDLLAKSDIISLHTPLTKETEHIINSANIAKMKEGVMIVNTARGPVVSLDDLCDGLKSGKIKAAALDVMEGEPDIPADHVIFSYENVILTPHSAFTSVESEIEMHEKVAKAVLDVLSGDLPHNCLNRKELQERAG